MLHKIFDRKSKQKPFIEEEAAFAVAAQSEHEKSKAIVGGLNDEAGKLKAFLAKAPEYRTSLLNGNQLERLHA